MISIHRLTAAALLSALLLANGLFASGFAIYETSARGFGMANVNVGKNDDASALYSNPAAITALEGTNTVAGAAFITPSVSLSVQPGSHLLVGAIDAHKVEMDGYTETIPYFYTTHRLSERWAFGLGIYVPYGLKSKFSQDWVGRYNNVMTEIQVINFNPNIAVTLLSGKPLVKRLSVAAGLQAMYAKVDIQRVIPPTVIPGDPLLRLKGDNIAYGYNLSLQWEINDLFAFGAQYRSHVNQKFDKADAYADAPALFPGGRVHATGSIDLPQSLSLGFNFTPSERLNIGFQALWTGWSSYDTLDIYIDNAMGWIRSTKEWDDVWRYSVGAEYKLTEKIALRAGFTYDKDPVNSEHAEFMVPSNDRTIYTIGFGYNIGDSGTFNIAYGYLRIKSALIRSGRYPTDTVLSDTRVNTGHANIIVADLRWKF